MPNWDLGVRGYPLASKGRAHFTAVVTVSFTAESWVFFTSLRSLGSNIGAVGNG